MDEINNLYRIEYIPRGRRSLYVRQTQLIFCGNESGVSFLPDEYY